MSCKHRSTIRSERPFSRKDASKAFSTIRTRADIPRANATRSFHSSARFFQTSVRSTTPVATWLSDRGTNRDKTDSSDRRNLKKALHLADDKTARLDCAVPVREVRSEWIVEMEDQLHTAVRQNSFRQRAIDSAIALQRPDGFYERCERRMDRIFAIARLNHCVVDLIAFAPSDSSGASLV